MSIRRAGALLFLGVALVYCLSPVVTNSDSYLTVPTATSIVHDRDFDLTEYLDVPLVASHYSFQPENGAYLNEFPWATSLFAVPSVVVADVGHAVGIGPGADLLVRRDQMGGMQLVTASLITAAAVVAVMLLAYRRLGGDADRRRRLALLIAVVVAFGTTAWSVASRSLWQHGPSMLFVSLALLALVRLTKPPEDTPRPPWLYAGAAGASLAVAFAIRPTNAVAVAALGVWLLVTRRQHLVAFAAGAGVVVVPWLLVTTITYGQPLQPYGSASRLSLHAEYLDALAANVVSPGRGLLLFSPIALAAVVGVVIARRRRLLDGLLVAAAVTVVGQWLVVSAYGENWVGGHSYGPRFFTDVIPFLVLLAIPAVDAVAELPAGRRRTVAITTAGVLVAVSLFVHVQGGVLKSAQCWNTDPVPIELDNDRVWSWSDPLLTRGVRRVLDGVPILEGCATALQRSVAASR